MQKLLKPILKFLLKTCVPVVGSLAVDVADSALFQWVDGREKAAADDLSSRLLLQVEASIERIADAEHLGEARLKALLAQAATAVGATPHFLAQWAQADFDAGLAAVSVVQDYDAAHPGNTDHELALLQMLVGAMFGALHTESQALSSTEAQFRKTVLTRLDGLGTQVRSLAQHDLEALQEAVRASMMTLHFLPWRADQSPPGALLRADIDDPVPFHGRDDDLADALAWVDSSAQFAVRLYTGAGGIGKTRLSRELVLSLRRRGWEAGMLDTSHAANNGEVWRVLANAPSPSLWVIDYAENRRDHVSRLLKELLLAPHGSPPKRVLLLARAADDWWAQLKRQGDGVGDLLTGPGTHRIRLQALATSASAREASYMIAARHFATKLQRVGDVMVPLDLHDDAYERTLLLHMAALAAVQGQSVQGDQGILEHVLGRERRFWAEHAAQRGLPEYLHRGIGRAMAAITLRGGTASAQQSTNVLRALPYFADQPMAVCTAVVQMLHELYPGDRWIEPILPDLLGEHLVQEELADDPEALLGIALNEDQDE